MDTKDRFVYVPSKLKNLYEIRPAQNPEKNTVKKSPVLSMATKEDRKKTEAAACYLMGVSSEKLKELDEALKNYHKALILNPDHIDAMVGLGSIISNPPSERYHEAENLFRKALSLNEHHIEANYNLGNCLRIRSEYVQAMKHYRIALSICSSYADAHYNLGLTYEQLRQLPLAVEQYQLYLEHAPEDELDWRTEALTKIAELRSKIEQNIQSRGLHLIS